MFEICSDMSKTGLKIYFFRQHSKKAKKWPNGKTILFLANSFKKGQIWQIWPLKRPNGNPVAQQLKVNLSTRLINFLQQQQQQQEKNVKTL